MYAGQGFTEEAPAGGGAREQGLALVPTMCDKHWAACVCFLYDQGCWRRGGRGEALGLRIASSVNQAAREGLALWLVGRTRSTPLGVPSFLEGVSDPTLVTGTALPGQGFSELIPTLEKQDWCWRDVVEHRTRGRGGRALFLKHSTRPVCPQYPLCAGGPPGCDGSLAGGHSIVLVSPCIPQST